MNKILDYLELAAFCVGILIGVQIPEFVDQYGKNLDARVSESENSISEFQDDAEKYFGGDISQLIEHYNNKADPVIISGGESIEALVSRNQFLIKAQRNFNHSIYGSYVHVLIMPVEEIKKEVWSSYTYGLVLNGSAISVGILVGLIVLALFELLVFMLRLAHRALNNSRCAAS